MPLLFFFPLHVNLPKAQREIAYAVGFLSVALFLHGKINSPYFRLHFSQAMNDLSCFLRNQPKQKIDMFCHDIPMMAYAGSSIWSFLGLFFFCDSIFFITIIIIIIGTCTFIVFWKALWSKKIYIVLHCNKSYFNGWHKTFSYVTIFWTASLAEI